MTLAEFYESIGGYEDVSRRMRKDALIAKFVKKFTSDGNYGALLTALDRQDYEAAFHFIHTLKGIVSNLGFTRLWNAADRLTEELRPEEGKVIDAERIAAARKAMQEEYERVTAAILHYEREEEEKYKYGQQDIDRG